MKQAMRVNTSPAHISRRRANRGRKSVKTHWVMAVADIWLKEQPAVIQGTLKKYV